MKKLLFVMLAVLVAGAAFAQEGEKKDETKVEKKEFKASFSPDLTLISKYQIGLTDKFNKFALERMYMGFKANVAENVSMRVTYDVNWDSDLASVNAMLKYAYMEVKDLIPMNTLVIGVQKTGYIDYVDNSAWGHRDLSKIAIDGNSLDTSADMGLALDGKTPCGMLSWNLALLSGGGYKIFDNKMVEPNTQKAFSFRGTITPFAGDATLGGLTLSIYGKQWINGTDIVPDELLALNIGFSMKDLLRVGIEYIAKDVNGGAPKNALSAYATFMAIPKSLDIIGRYDSYDPNTAADDDQTRTIYLGAKYWLAKKSAVSLLFSSKTVGTADAKSQVDMVFSSSF